MGTWHEHLDRRSKAGMAFHEGTMHPFYLAEEKRSAAERKKRFDEEERKAIDMMADKARA